jgi:hypothetical protein
VTLGNFRFLLFTTNLLMRPASLLSVGPILLGVIIIATSAVASGGGRHRGGNSGVGFVGTPAVGGPEPLRNKTIVLSWQEYRVQKADSGETKRSSTGSVMSIYVSSSGRLFTRLERRSGGGRSNTTGHGPEGDEQQSGEGASQLNPSFDGQELNIVTPMKSGARDVKATFDSGFGHCSLRVIFGRDNGELPYHRAMNGQMYRILSTEVSGAQCSIRSGNAVRE